MPGHFSITKRDFGSTWPDVWGFRSHFTHNKRGRETGKKKTMQNNWDKTKMALNKQQEKQ
jgi:hypothetical protein